MSEEIKRFLMGKVTGANPKLARENIANIISRMPEWAQASLLRDDVLFEDIRPGIMTSKRGGFMPPVNGKPAVFYIQSSRARRGEDSGITSATGVTFHEAGHGVDHLHALKAGSRTEVLGASICNADYRNFAESFLKRSTAGLNSAERRILSHAKRRNYVNQFEEIAKIANIDSEKVKAIAPTHELQSETARYYFSAYDRHAGDTAKVEAEMSESLPNLWPAFRDHLIREYTEKTKQRVAELKKQGMIKELSKGVAWSKGPDEGLGNWLAQKTESGEMLAFAAAAVGLGVIGYAIKSHRDREQQRRVESKKALNSTAQNMLQQQ